MKYRLQSMYNHMVGRAASGISPFYFILLGELRFFETIRGYQKKSIIKFSRAMA